MLSSRKLLIGGDVAALAVVTLVGFVSHGETDLSYYAPRFAAAFLPAAITWLLIAPWFGLFEERVIDIPVNLWRILPAMLFSAPAAVILRAAMLNNAALPLFALIFGLTNALGMILWRGAYLMLARRQVK